MANFIAVERVFLVRSTAIDVTEMPPEIIQVVVIHRESMEVRPVHPQADLCELTDVSLVEIPGDRARRVIRRDFIYGREQTADELSLELGIAVRSRVEHSRNARILQILRYSMPDVDETFGSSWTIDRFPQFPELNLEVGRVKLRSGMPLPERRWIVEDITDNPRFTPLGLLQHVPVVQPR